MFAFTNRMSDPKDKFYRIVGQELQELDSTDRKLLDFGMEQAITSCHKCGESISVDKCLLVYDPHVPSSRSVTQTEEDQLKQAFTFTLEGRIVHFCY